MITYVNTVLVSNNGAGLHTTKSTFTEGFAQKSDLDQHVGSFVFMNLDEPDPTVNNWNPYEIPATGIVKKFKIGIFTDKVITTKEGKFIPVIKWSNEIKTADIKSIAKLNHPGTPESTEDTIVVNFNRNFPTTLAQRGGFPIVLRLTFKDTPTRYRNWSESYDYFVNPNDSASNVATGLAESINGQSRRARVYASASNGVLTLTAMPYDDNEGADSENFNAKVRFNANVWYSDPMAPGFASNNKYAIGTISKTAGKEYAASAKNIRDHERTAQGYQGIMHRGCWYDPKPAMTVKMGNKYGAVTIEFENMYRAADDIFRKTKQTVELYGSSVEGTAIAADNIALQGQGTESAVSLISKIEDWVEALASVNNANNSSAYSA